MTTTLTNEQLAALNMALTMALAMETGAPRTAAFNESVPRFAEMVRPLGARGAELADRLMAAI